LTNTVNWGHTARISRLALVDNQFLP